MNSLGSDEPRRSSPGFFEESDVFFNLGSYDQPHSFADPPSKRPHVDDSKRLVSSHAEEPMDQRTSSFGDSSMYMQNDLMDSGYGFLNMINSEAWGNGGEEMYQAPPSSSGDAYTYISGSASISGNIPTNYAPGSYLPFGTEYYHIAKQPDIQQAQPIPKDLESTREYNQMNHMIYHNLRDYGHLSNVLQTITMEFLNTRTNTAEYDVPWIPLGPLGAKSVSGQSEFDAEMPQEISQLNSIQPVPYWNRHPNEVTVGTSHSHSGITIRDITSYLQHVPKYPGGFKWPKAEDKVAIPRKEITPLVHKLLEEGYDIRLGEKGRSLLKKEISRRFRRNSQLRDDCLRHVCRLKNANVIQLLAMSEITGCFLQCLQITNEYWKSYSERRRFQRLENIGDVGVLHSIQPPLSEYTQSNSEILKTPIRKTRGRPPGRKKSEGLIKTQKMCSYNEGEPIDTPPTTAENSSNGMETTECDGGLEDDPASKDEEQLQLQLSNSCNTEADTAEGSPYGTDEDDGYDGIKHEDSCDDIPELEKTPISRIADARIKLETPSPNSANRVSKDEELTEHLMNAPMTLKNFKIQVKIKKEI